MVLVSDEYKEQLQKYHANNTAWGTGAGKWVDEVRAQLKGDERTILDYGCGKGKLGIAMREKYPNITVVDYDPGIPGKDAPPRGVYDLVASRDVLEHVEPELLDDVLSDIQKRALRGVWLMIHTKAAGAVLPDGRNAHLIQEGLKWWTKTLEPFFPGHQIEEQPPWVRVTWRRP